MVSYKTVGKESEAEFVEKKSRFIGAICPVPSEEDAIQFVKSRKSLHPQSTHNCWAYVLKNNGIQRYSDDGEPNGTAGIPILEVLKKEEIFNAAIVVTRYYGGIMLGAGGLVRAYSHGAKIALDSGGRVLMVPCTLLQITVNYPIYQKILPALEAFTLTILDTTFTENVTLEIRILTEDLDKLSTTITELSSGDVSPLIVGEVFSSV